MLQTQEHTVEHAAHADTVVVARQSWEQLQGELKFANTKVEALSFELARLKRWRFGSSSESVHEQGVLFETLLQDTRSEDEAAQPAQQTVPQAPALRRAVRQGLPESLPRIEHHYEIQATVCECGQALERIGQEISEQLDCVPAQFFVHRHIRGKYVCRCCQTIRAEPMPAQVIDKGLPAPGLLAQVLIAKHDDHLPLYRQEEIYARSGVHIPRSSMAQWVGICGQRLSPLAQALREHILEQGVIHVDETPVELMVPGRGKTKKAYMWVYRSTNFEPQRAVLYDFTLGRGGEHPRRVLQGYSGTLMHDDYSGYLGLHATGNITAALCMAHARRKLFEAYELNGSQIAGHAVALIAKLYEIERQARELDVQAREQLRQQQAKPIADALHAWLTEQRQRLVKADATAKAIDYALSNWAALTRYLDDGKVPIDNNPAENALRPLVVGRKNWLFVGSQQAGERAAVIMSLIESAKLNGHDPWAYFKNILGRLPTTLNKDIASLLPHNWRPVQISAQPSGPPKPL